jgi:isocitrate lyase
VERGQHQRGGGDDDPHPAGNFDQVLMTVTAGQASTGALEGSTEQAQFA